MISNEKLTQLLRDIKGVDFVKVDGDGYHYQLTIVSDEFKGKSIVARQQWVYKNLKEFIASGSLHAITMKTWTQEEWEKNCG